MILASASPRRYELLHRIGIEPQVWPANVNEQALAAESPMHLVERLARLKAQAVWSELSPSERTGEVVLAADTIVWTPELGILGKPRTHEDAFNMLQHLSGHTHSVSTGVCLVLGQSKISSGTDALSCEKTPNEPQVKSFVDTTRVTFYPLEKEQIRAYVETGEPMDKAGAYGIQGIGRLLVQSIEGDYNNVVGLPVARVVRELSKLTGRDLMSELLLSDKGMELVSYDD